MNNVQLHHPDLQRLFELATQPVLRDWLEGNHDRAAQLSPDEIDELLSLQGTGGPLTIVGIEHFVGVIERRREIVRKVKLICGTDRIDRLEWFVDLVYEEIQPYRGRGG